MVSLSQPPSLYLSLSLSLSSVRNSFIQAIILFTQCTAILPLLHIYIVLKSAAPSSGKWCTGPTRQETGQPAMVKKRKREKEEKAAIDHDPSWVGKTYDRASAKRMDLGPAGTGRWLRATSSDVLGAASADPSGGNSRKALVDSLKVVREDLACRIAGFAPQQNTMMIEGRPVQVLVSALSMLMLLSRSYLSRGAIRPLTAQYALTGLNIKRSEVRT